jgi:hypothetical protein
VDRQRFDADPDRHKNGNSDPDRLNMIHKAGGEVPIYPHTPEKYGKSHEIYVQIN